MPAKLRTKFIPVKLGMKFIPVKHGTKFIPVKLDTKLIPVKLFVSKDRVIMEESFDAKTQSKKQLDRWRYFGLTADCAYQTSVKQRR